MAQPRSITYPPYMAAEASSLAAALMVGSPAKRLGSTAPPPSHVGDGGGGDGGGAGGAEVQAHPFWGGADYFRRLLLHEVAPPRAPEPSPPMNTSP